ncbi:hybrid sensor histidine kinase/response regulator [Paenibacillus sp. PDC88]|uniref:hybrid sensor histidine kinase/response regulator n=1 Tax=Paenibacillus sp. PDC88 TaxID=1884375 RepID=UPI0008983D90|nr:hybrid sensor histidine kinase/response regulator [Paenibacillus sp. PDC88]SDW18390.1 Signal transduction histidine kinase [Paenibacillus sp. PDC88]
MNSDHDLEMTRLRHLIEDLNKEIIRSKEQEQRLLQEFSSMNNELVTLQRELTKNNLRLAEAREDAVHANEAKTEFLALLSHEFRTPLNGILGMAEVLSLSELSEEQRQSVSVIQESSHILLHLINDLLDLSKLEAGEMKLNPSSMDLRAIVKHVTLLLSQKALDKGNRIVADIDSSIFERFAGDTARMTQVLTNLMGNANKFTKNGLIRIRIIVLSQTEQEQRLRIEVTDNGIGISQAEQDKLFKPYSQTREGQKSEHGGTGLGLSICKSFVELMGGKIGVISEQDAGSTFWIEVSFPSEKVTGEASEAATYSMRRTNSLHRAEQSKIQHPILLAEDNGINRKVVLVQLKKLGITNVETVENGEAAVSAYLSKPYSLILMDNLMPKLGGIEAAEKIRQIERDEMKRHTPIIALTGNVFPGERDKCLQAGMDDYIAKPISLDALKEIIQRWITGRDDQILNQETMAELMDLGDDQDSELLSTLLEMYQNDTPDKINRLIQYVKDRNYSRTIEVSHDLKSSSLSLGIHYLSTLFAAIEEAAKSGCLDSIDGLLEGLMPAYLEACTAMEKHL